MLSKNDVITTFENETRHKIIRASRTRLGHSSITYKLITEDEKEYYFKQGKNNYKIQYDLCDKLNKIGVKTPEIVSFGNQWIIEKKVEGKRLDVTNKKLAGEVLTQFGEILQKVHSIGTSDYGELINTDTGQYHNYIQYYDRVLNLISSKYLKLAISYIDKKHDICLNHGDVAPNHIYVDKNNNFISLIDWDDVVSAPKYFDLSELLLNLDNSENYWNHFMEGYSKSGEYISCKNIDLLISELLQATESYYWYLNDDRSDKELAQTEKNRIKKIEMLIDNL